MIVVTDESSRADLAEAICHLRAKQRAACLAEIRAEVGAAIDELLDAWAKARA